MFKSTYPLSSIDQSERKRLEFFVKARLGSTKSKRHVDGWFDKLGFLHITDQCSFIMGPLSSVKSKVLLKDLPGCFCRCMLVFKFTVKGVESNLGTLGLIAMDLEAATSAPEVNLNDFHSVVRFWAHIKDVDFWESVTPFERLRQAALLFDVPIIKETIVDLTKKLQRFLTEDFKNVLVEETRRYLLEPAKDGMGLLSISEVYNPFGFHYGRADQSWQLDWKPRRPSTPPTPDFILFLADVFLAGGGKIKVLPSVVVQALEQYELVGHFVTELDREPTEVEFQIMDGLYSSIDARDKDKLVKLIEVSRNV